MTTRRDLVPDSEIMRVVTRLNDGWNNKQIAADLPISHAMVSLIRLGKMWGKQTSKLGYVPKAQFIRKRA